MIIILLITKTVKIHKFIIKIFNEIIKEVFPSGDFSFIGMISGDFSTYKVYI